MIVLVSPMIKHEASIFLLVHVPYPGEIMHEAHRLDLEQRIASADFWNRVLEGILKTSLCDLDCHRVS